MSLTFQYLQWYMQKKVVLGKKIRASRIEQG